MQSLVLQAEQSFWYGGAVIEVWRWKVSFQDWVKIRTERRVLCFDSSYIILFLDAFSLRQGVGQLQLELVWVKQQFRDSRRREGGAEEGARSAPRLQVFWHMQSPSKLLRYPVIITLVSPLLPFRGEKTSGRICAMLLRRCVRFLNDHTTSWILPNLAHQKKERWCCKMRLSLVDCRSWLMDTAPRKRGLAKKFTAVPAIVDTLRCDCSLVGCGCCDGFGGNLTFSNLKSPDSNHSLHLLSSACSALSCESINNTNGKNLGKIQSFREGMGTVRVCWGDSMTEMAFPCHKFHPHIAATLLNPVCRTGICFCCPQKLEKLIRAVPQCSCCFSWSMWI